MSKPHLVAALAALSVSVLVSGCMPASSPPPAGPVDVSSLPVVVAGGAEDVLGPTRGDVVVLVFFTTWCPASSATMAMAANLCAEQTKVRCIAVDEGDTPAEIGRFFDASQRRMIVASDRDASLAKQLALPTVPSIVVLDRHGVARHVQAGYHGADDAVALSSEVAALL
jgi:thiol-disulfide isomerase/thioredoxin